MSDSFFQTGQDSFDMLFDGKGIYVDPKATTTILVQGSAGAGKTTLALQLAFAAWDKRETPCLYYSFEQSGTSLHREIEQFGWKIPGKVLNYRNINDPQDKIDSDIRTPLLIVERTQSDVNTIANFFEAIASHIQHLRSLFDKSPVVVLDSIGAIEKLQDLERSHLLNLFSKLVGSVLIVIRESDAQMPNAHPEYLFDVVFNLIQPNLSEISSSHTPPLRRLHILKTRNQKSEDGPHYFEIHNAASVRSPLKPGFVVFPAIHSINAITDRSQLLKRNSGDNTPNTNEYTSGAEFGIKELDEALVDRPNKSTPIGLPYGESMLVEGPPGCLKTELALQFLQYKLSSKEATIFVSARLSEDAVRNFTGLTLDESDRDTFHEGLAFVDARQAYRVPEQIMDVIRHEVERGPAQRQVRKAVIFGIGLLDRWSAFPHGALSFLQVLISYFRDKGVSGLFIDWPFSDNKTGHAYNAAPLQDFFAYGIQLSASKGGDSRRQGIARSDITSPVVLARKNHRFWQRPLGSLRLSDGKLVIQQTEALSE